MSSPENVERLFLLEILVDNVYISLSDLDLHPRVINSLKQTCVKFQFLNYPPLEICEEDFRPAKDNYNDDEVPFKSGKSCLFAVKGQHPQAFSPPFNVHVTVCKMMGNKKPCAIGKTCIKLGECFATLVNCCIVCPTAPTSKVIRDTYPLIDEKDCGVGTITVFIRLSCFGKYIITQFQLGGAENKSFLFRAESEIEKMDKSKEKVIIPTQHKPGESISKPKSYCLEPNANAPVGKSLGQPAMPPPPQFPCPPPFMGGGMPMPMPNMMPPMMPPYMNNMMSMAAVGKPTPHSNKGICEGPKPGEELGGGDKNWGVEYLPDHDYKELTASVNGHELCIKILRKPKKQDVSQKSTTRASSSSSEVPICRCSDGKTKRRHGKKKCRRKGRSTPNSNNGGAMKLLCIPNGGSFPTMMKTCAGNNQNQSNDKNMPPKKDVIKESFTVKLGNRPQYPAEPTTVDKAVQYDQLDMDAAAKLYEDILKSSVGAKSDSQSVSKKGKKIKKGKKK